MATIAADVTGRALVGILRTVTRSVSEGRGGTPRLRFGLL